VPALRRKLQTFSSKCMLSARMFLFGYPAMMCQEDAVLFLIPFFSGMDTANGAGSHTSGRSCTCEVWKWQGTLGAEVVWPRSTIICSGCPLRHLIKTPSRQHLHENNFSFGADWKYQLYDGWNLFLSSPLPPR